ncbi:hypothetical protein AB0M68_38320 [Streptomyces sp. NPDC051453]|uniref:hypothetical protein n=1 Tax=Streptomyces sp. NPDC051453 TaxID=3154941 RepID=UPI003444CDCE
MLGTDDLGRDVLARTLIATHLTLELTLAATVRPANAGILLGTAVWVSGSRLRELFASPSCASTPAARPTTVNSVGADLGVNAQAQPPTPPEGDRP